MPAPGPALYLPVPPQPHVRPCVTLPPRHPRQRHACRAAAAAQGLALTCLAGRATGALLRGGALVGACGAADGAPAKTNAVITTRRECAATLPFSHPPRLGVVVRGADLVPPVADAI